MKMLCAAAAAFILLGAASLAAEDTLDTVLERAGQYVLRFREELSGIVAEERYAQDIRQSSGMSTSVDGRGTSPALHRDLVSDIVMVRTPERYVEFRDVFQVDGRQVRDREDRLAKLFLAPDAAGGDAQIVRINEESARYNIGNIYRNFNTPALALMFLEPDIQGRFKFRRVDNKPPTLASRWNGGVAARFAPPPHLWAIEYQEAQKGTLIRRQPGNTDMPSRGRFWIEPDTGRVLLSELQVGDPLTRATIAVAFADDPVASVRVPVEMRERYVNGTSRVTTEGTAQYGRLRRFSVGTDEVIPPVKEPQ